MVDGGWWMVDGGAGSNTNTSFYKQQYFIKFCILYRSIKFNNFNITKLNPKFSIKFSILQAPLNH